MLKVASQRGCIAFLLTAAAGTTSAAATPMLDDFATNIDLFANNASSPLSVDKISADLSKDNFNGKADFKFSSFQLLARLRF